MAKITVLMPVYNTPTEYLKEAVDSILAQTYIDFELFVIDDGSTDLAIKETIKSYKDKRIKYFYKKNGDIGDALNYGLKRAKSEFIARMDSDDISLPDRFEKQVKFLTEHPDVSIVGSWIRFFGDVEFTYEYPENVGFLDMLTKCRLAHPSIMFRRQDFEKYNLWYNPEVSPAEDYELWSRAIYLLKMANIPQVLLRYRWHQSNSSTVRGEKQLRVKESVQQNMLDFLTSDVHKQKHIKTQLCTDKKFIRLGLPLLTVVTSPTYFGIYLFGFIKIFSKKRLRK